MATAQMIIDFVSMLTRLIYIHATCQVQVVVESEITLYKWL